MPAGIGWICRSASATGGQATVAAQAAERFYRALAADAPSRVRTRLTVGAGGALEWLPQETILFDRCALDRRLEVDLAADARFLGVETLVFGRAAMGERVRQGWLRDLIRVRRGGELLLHDAIRMDGEIDACVAARGGWRRRAGGGDGGLCGAGCGREIGCGSHRCMASTAAIASLAPSAGGASVWNGMLVARILGPDSASVRRVVVAALDVLREARPLPRVWLC